MPLHQRLVEIDAREAQPRHGVDLGNSSPTAPMRELAVAIKDGRRRSYFFMTGTTSRAPEAGVGPPLSLSSTSPRMSVPLGA